MRQYGKSIYFGDIWEACYQEGRNPFADYIASLHSWVGIWQNIDNQVAPHLVNPIRTQMEDEVYDEKKVPPHQEDD